MTVTFFHYGIEFSDRNETVFYFYEEIMHITCEKPYCLFYCKEKDRIVEYLIKTALTTVKTNLPITFFRCNQSVIINISYLRTYRKRENKLIMNNDESFILSRQNKGEFTKHLKKVRQISCNKCLFCTCFEKNELCNRCYFIPDSIPKQSDSTE